jgi:hypothetical protein
VSRSRRSGLIGISGSVVVWVLRSRRDRSIFDLFVCGVSLVRLLGGCRVAIFGGFGDGGLRHLGSLLFETFGRVVHLVVGHV